jgi:hypothetical protein
MEERVDTLVPYGYADVEISTFHAFGDRLVREHTLEMGLPPDYCEWGLIDAYRLRHADPGRYTWWDYRAGNFHRNVGMRIDHLLVTPPVAARAVWAEIDREARKGKPLPSDHAPLVVDLDQPGHPFDAGWEAAAERIAGRLAPAPPARPRRRS